MTLPTTVEDDSDVTLTAYGPITHLCPHVDEVDNGTVTITWRTRGGTFELHSLAGYLAGFKDTRLSHEQITDRIRRDLSTFEDVEVLAVETVWRTAGMGVTCSTSPTPAETP